MRVRAKLPMATKKQDNVKRLVLLDSHAILHRAFHALPDFATSAGMPTGALYGLATMIFKVMDELKPHYIIAVRDMPGGTFRDTLFADYKATRVEADPALIQQLERAPEIFNAFKVPVYGVPGYEADDLLGTIVAQLRTRKDLEIVIATGDMDTLQLVEGERVRVYTLRQGITDTILYDSLRVYERYGFGPDKVVDYKGIRGDPSDNIPGVKGVGETSAIKLIQAFGALEDIYKAIEAQGVEAAAKEAGVQKRYVQLVADNKQQAYLSRDLATIHPEVPFDFTFPEREWDLSDSVDSIDAMCETFEFRSIKERVRARIKHARPPEEERPEETVDPQEARETAIALWLLKSDFTNPSVDDVLSYTNVKTFKEAREKIFQKLRETGRLQEVYDRIEQPLIEVIQRMNRDGVCLDKKALQALSKEYSRELGVIAGRIFQHAGHEFNINSTRQLGVVLFDELKITSGKLKKTATGVRSTKEEELAKLADAHPIVNDILAYRELYKLLSTYVEKMVELIASDGRLHAEFLQAGTTTGRMSSQNPNLQNIPIRTEYGKRIRNAFNAPEGKKLVAIDYSQIELRVAAGLSGDVHLLEVFQSGGDIHAAVASRVFKVDSSQVDKEMRRRAKVINFGILYGMGINALRASLGEGVSREEASAFLDEYFASYPQLAQWIERVKKDAAKNGYTETIFGRRRYFSGFDSTLPHMRAQAERMAINAPIQGTQADIIKLAMVKADKLIEEKGQREGIKLVLQVHDELVYEIDENIALDSAREIRAVMESVVTNDALSGVQIIAEVAIGDNWGEMEKIPR